MKTVSTTCWVIFKAENGNTEPRVSIEGVYKTRKQAEAKLKWKGNPLNYYINPSKLHIELRATPEGEKK